MKKITALILTLVTMMVCTAVIPAVSSAGASSGSGCASAVLFSGWAVMGSVSPGTYTGGLQRPQGLKPRW